MPSDKTLGDWPQNQAVSLASAQRLPRPEEAQDEAKRMVALVANFQGTETHLAHLQCWGFTGLVRKLWE